MRFQQKEKSLIEIAKKKPIDYSIKKFHGAGKTYSLIYRHRKNMISEQSSDLIANQVELTWLTRYPLPSKIRKDK